ncbi:MAG: molybdenum cofactor biosynthesis protein MoaB, partial [Lachnospiraceae bacterium]
MKLIDTKDAVGYALCHDITQIVKGKVKDAVFRRGHVVTEEDLPILLSVGKDHIYVLEESDKDLMHEDDCAQYMIDLTIGENMSFTPVKEGKMELVSEIDGYLTVDAHLLHRINMLDDLMLASIQGNSVVKKGTKIAGMRIIPIFVKKSQMEELRDLIGDKKLFEIKPFVRKTAGIVTTGNEVYHKRIKDEFTPVVKEKLAKYGVEVIGHETVYDDTEMIANA